MPRTSRHLTTSGFLLFVLSVVVLGAIAYLTGMPEYPASDIVTAIAVGAASGLAATGANQIGKQFIKDKEVFG